MSLIHLLLQVDQRNNDFLSFQGLSTVDFLCYELGTEIKDILVIKDNVFYGFLSWACVMTLNGPTHGQNLIR